VLARPLDDSQAARCNGMLECGLLIGAQPPSVPHQFAENEARNFWAVQGVHATRDVLI
jgi:hypothetical protein